MELFLFSLLWFHDASPCIWIRRLVAHFNLFHFMAKFISTFPSFLVAFNFSFLWDSFVPDFPLFSESISDSTGRYLYEIPDPTDRSGLGVHVIGAWAGVLSPNWLAPARARRAERLCVDRLGFRRLVESLFVKTLVLGIYKCPKALDPAALILKTNDALFP